jgi:MscS family membrane protein
MLVTFRRARRIGLVCLLVLGLDAVDAGAQSAPSPAAQPAAIPPEAPRDALGRTTPRGTVLGFLAAARKGDDALASHYLSTPPGPAAEDLAHKLFIVLDARLPARLTEVSDAPEGSRANPLAPDLDRVGTIDGPDGAVEVLVERITRPTAEPIWLFSQDTLRKTPVLYDDVLNHREPWLPRFLGEHRLGRVRALEWVAVLLALPALYFLTVLLNRALAPAVEVVARRVFRRSPRAGRITLPAPAHLLVLSIAGHWLFSSLPLSLFVRQRLTNAAILVAICASVWLLILLNGELERYLARRVRSAHSSAAVSLLRVVRRMADVVAVVAGVLATLRHFGVDATPVLAGLGVGGIAVALAAQKTLENVIGGASLIFDQALRIGDFLKVGELVGTVDHIGLRSTRIRTLDRTIVSVPNGQIANMTLETLSARDKFWFHPIVGLRYDTTSDQMHAVIDGIRRMLVDHAAMEPASVHVRFLRLAPFSMDVEVFGYVRAANWGEFLGIQEQLLFGITDIVARAGTALALPSQTMYFEPDRNRNRDPGSGIRDPGLGIPVGH